MQRENVAEASGVANIIQLVIRNARSGRALWLGGGAYGALWAIRPVHEVRGSSVPILCPIRLIPSKVPARLGYGHLASENLSANFM